MRQLNYAYGFDSLLPQKQHGRMARPFTQINDCSVPCACRTARRRIAESSRCAISLKPCRREDTMRIRSAPLFDVLPETRALRCRTQSRRRLPDMERSMTANKRCYADKHASNLSVSYEVLRICLHSFFLFDWLTNALLCGIIIKLCRTRNGHCMEETSQ